MKKQQVVGQFQRTTGATMYGIILGGFVGWALSGFAYFSTAPILIFGMAFFAISIGKSRVDQLYQSVKDSFATRFRSSSEYGPHKTTRWEILDGVRMSILATVLLLVPSIIVGMTVTGAIGVILGFLQEGPVAETTTRILGLGVVVFSRICIGVIITLLLAMAFLLCCKLLRRLFL